MNRRLVLGVAAISLVLCGCEEEGSDQRLIEIAAKQGEHEVEIGQIARKTEGVDKRLDEMQRSLQKIAPPPAPSVAEKATTPQVLELKDTPEYKRIAAELSSVQQRLSALQGDLAKAQDSFRERGGNRGADAAEAFRAMSNPRELSGRLDTLARNFSQKIQDPVRRQQFEADVERLKRSLQDNVGTQDAYQRILDDLKTRLANTQDGRGREFIEREIKSLESASGEELEGRLERYTRFQSFRQVRDLVEKYDIPREVVTDSGLVTFGGRGEEGRGGPGRRGGPR